MPAGTSLWMAMSCSSRCCTITKLPAGATIRHTAALHSQAAGRQTTTGLSPPGQCLLPQTLVLSHLSTCCSLQEPHAEKQPRLWLSAVCDGQLIELSAFGQAWSRIESLCCCSNTCTSRQAACSRALCCRHLHGRWGWSCWKSRMAAPPLAPSIWACHPPLMSLRLQVHNYIVFQGVHQHPCMRTCIR